MATLERVHIVSPISKRESGARPHTYNATYEIHLTLANDNEKTDSALAMTLARESVAANVPPNDRLPRLGESMNVTYGVGPGPDRKRLIDANVYALEFDCNARNNSNACYQCRVTWRAARAGTGEGDPQQLQFYQPPWKPKHTGSGSGTPIPGAPPIDLEWWWEWTRRDDPIRRGRKRTVPPSPDQDPGDFEKDESFFVNTAGQPLGSISQGVEDAVLVVEYSTDKESECRRLNDKYRNTRNDKNIILRLGRTGSTGLPVPEGKMAFERVDQSRIYERGWKGYLVQARWRISQEIIFARFDNVGTYHKAESGSDLEISVAFDDNQMPLSPPFPLKRDGTLAKTAADVFPYMDYIILADAKYEDEVWIDKPETT